MLFNFKNINFFCEKCQYFTQKLYLNLCGNMFKSTENITLEKCIKILHYIATHCGIKSVKHGQNPKNKIFSIEFYCILFFH